MQRICLSLEKNKGNKNPHDDVYIYLREYCRAHSNFGLVDAPTLRSGIAHYAESCSLYLPTTLIQKTKFVQATIRIAHTYPSSTVFSVIYSTSRQSRAKR